MADNQTSATRAYIVSIRNGLPSWWEAWQDGNVPSEWPRRYADERETELMERVVSKKDTLADREELNRLISREAVTDAGR